MRYFILLLLFPVSLVAQNDIASSKQYVWAKSGLVLRAEGKPDGQKLATLPYGAAVEITGRWGAEFSLPTIPERFMEGEYTPAWNMPGMFVEVRYGTLTGYAFNGFISNYNPADFEQTIAAKETGGEERSIDTLSFFRDSTRAYTECSLLYPNGIIEKRYAGRNAVGGVYVVANGSLAQGYLIADKWFDVGSFDSALEDWQNPFLIEASGTSLTFNLDLLQVTIKECFGVVLIMWDATC